MGVNLARIPQAAISKAAQDSGLALAADQVRSIAETESACLTESKRLSFGESAAARIIRELGSSPYIIGDDAGAAISHLTEAFYELREDHPASITDNEIVESLREAFDGEAAGDAGLATSLATETLSKRQDYSAYEIADDDGNVYRWNPAEWRDDVMADGWNGERWEDVDE